MMLFFVLSLCLSVGNGILPDMPTTVDSDVNCTLQANVSQGHATLNDMFKEVEELMEDTQHKLEDAVHQIDNESAKSSSYPQDYHHENISESVPANQSNHLLKQAEKVTDNATVETHFPRSAIQTSKENDINHECIIEEDCEKGTYCLYEPHHSQCLPCKEVDRSCSKDEECCSGNLCIWGQCSQNATKGERGSICQHQSDCNPDLCCAFHKALLFPVCNSKPIERERCYSSTNHLMELLSWDMEGEGPREHCPCAGELQCQHMGRGSMCLQPQNSSEEELTDTLYSEIDYII
ncbi:dickkopf-related protein 3a [Alosa pseudoharengus]|uniref:dickkopf-related protein 3a n=1 Tax=Alosa sapidissima TaxID=34773 RepID=UPI001C085718|nr:dickkopf-related protein 3a [Alosa sapidissima]